MTHADGEKGAADGHDRGWHAWQGTNGQALPVQGMDRSEREAVRIIVAGKAKPLPSVDKSGTVWA
jgi:hypothetical protein